MCALAHCHQHDIDHADRAERQRDHSYSSQEHVHHVENGSHHFRFLNRIPLVKGALIAGIESVIAADNLVNLLQRQQVLRRHKRLILDEGNGVLMVFSLEWEVRSHHLERNVATQIQPHVVAPAKMRHTAHHFKSDAIQKDERANRGTSGKQRLQQLVPEDDHIPPLYSV